MRLALPSLERIPGGRGFASLSRRVRTLIVATVLFLVLFILLLTMPVPYVVLSPGPTYNTLGSINGMSRFAFADEAHFAGPGTTSNGARCAPEVNAPHGAAAR